MPDEPDPPDPRHDPLAASADIASIGLASAAAVVERVLELGRATAAGLRLPLPMNSAQPLSPFVPASDGDGATDPAGAAETAEERGRQARRFRADAERFVELYADFARMLVDGAASLAEQAGGIPVTANGHGPATDVLVLGPASAGATTTSSAWVHVLDGPASVAAPLHASDLVAHDGAVVKGRAVHCEPDHLDTSAARTTAEVRVAVKVPKGTAPGTYHGHLLATGLPEVVLALRLEVVV